MSETSITEIELSEVEDNSKADATDVMQPKDISLIQALPVQLSVCVGEIKLSVKDLYGLKAGQVVKIDTQVNQPVKLMFDEQVVAQGLLVAVDDNYGVEITELADIKV